MFFFSNVFFQVLEEGVAVREALVAQFARLNLLRLLRLRSSVADVRLEMAGQLELLVKCFSAQATREGLLSSSMFHLVLGEIDGTLEDFVTELALVDVGADVGAIVTDLAGASREDLVTDVALVALLSRVNASVTGERISTRKCFVTELTLVLKVGWIS